MHATFTSSWSTCRVRVPWFLCSGSFWVLICLPDCGVDFKARELSSVQKLRVFLKLAGLSHHIGGDLFGAIDTRNMDGEIVNCR